VFRGERYCRIRGGLLEGSHILSFEGKGKRSPGRKRKEVLAVWNRFAPPELTRGRTIGKGRVEKKGESEVYIILRGGGEGLFRNKKRKEEKRDVEKRFCVSSRRETRCLLIEKEVLFTQHNNVEKKGEGATRPGKIEDERGLGQRKLFQPAFHQEKGIQGSPW